jgi:hypothetical protein
MAGTCTISTMVCVPKWLCEPGLTGFEADGCGNIRANTACAYREALMASCPALPANIVAGQVVPPITLIINQGSNTENYKLVFSGDFVAESAPFTVNAGTGQQQAIYGSMVFATGGAKTVIASLVKV